MSTGCLPFQSMPLISTLLHTLFLLETAVLNRNRNIFCLKTVLFNEHDDMLTVMYNSERVLGCVVWYFASQRYVIFYGYLIIFYNSVYENLFYKCHVFSMNGTRVSCGKLERLFLS